MTPLEIKLSDAISKEIQRQAALTEVINCDKLAQVCTRTIKAEMAAALRASAAKRAAEVNSAIDEATR